MNKHVLFFLLLIVCFSFFHGLQTTFASKITSNEKNEIVIDFKDTLNVHSFDLSKQQKSSSENNFPWIVALFIGVLSAIINLVVSRKIVNSNEKNLQKQIENAKQQTFIEYRATIAVKNRQDWLNDLRQCLSELLAASAFCTPDMTTQVDYHKFLEKVFLYQSRIELLLNSNKPAHSELLDSVGTLINALKMNREEYDNKHYRAGYNQIIGSARKLFEIQWAKIKKLE